MNYRQEIVGLLFIGLQPNRISSCIYWNSPLSLSVVVVEGTGASSKQPELHEFKISIACALRPAISRVSASKCMPTES